MSDVMKELLAGAVFGTVIGLILVRYFGPEIRSLRNRIFRRDGREGG
jgi:hypothetical protein